VKKILIIFILIAILFSNVQCKTNVQCKKRDPVEERLNTKISVKTHRGRGKEEVSIRWCIEHGVIAKGMTLDECNQAVNGEFVLLTKLEDDWGIYVYDDHQIWCENGVVSTITALKRDRMFKTLEYIRRERQKNPIWIR
jgi:hypothetical protein